MDSMTIVLPVESFLPLYALAWAGGLPKLAAAREAYPGWAAIQDLVLDNIAVFSVVQFNTSAVTLSTYAGWGVNGTNILILHDGIYADGQLLAGAVTPSAPPAQEMSSGNGSWQVIVGVVVGVGGALVVAAIIGAVWLARCGFLHMLSTTL